MRTVLCVALLLAACSSEPAAWRPATAVNETQLGTASGARDALGSALLQRLTAALAKGPAEAVGVCRAEAPELAMRVAKEKGVRIGRTSTRLRNPSNAAPAWAADVLGQGVPAGEAPQPRYFSGPTGELGALFPIVAQPLCMQCHGKDSDLAEPVRAQLARDYPTDRATGYAVGDLRGWFWVEVGKLP